MKKATAILLIDEQNKILLQHRENKPYIWNPNAWGTFGGGVEEGETFEDCVIRECFEETNYKLKNPVLLTKITQKDIQRDILIYTYYKRLRNQEKENLKLQEGDDWIWVNLEEMLELDWKIGNPQKEIYYEKLKELI